jgi:thiol-disulfide isomerase/thioredoxin
MKTEEELARDTESRCCLCGTPWNKYRGQYKCREPLCKVPVLVCFACADAGKPKSQPTYCPLCVEGHDLRAKAMPDMVAQKQQLFGGDVCAPPADAAAKASAAGSHSRQRKAPRVLEPSRRVFVGNLPLLVAASDIRAALEAAAGEAPGALEWIRDRSTGAFFGSIFVGMSSVDAAKRLVAAGGKGIRLAGAGGCKRARLLRVSFAPYQGAWPPAQHVESELPPLGPPPAPPAACKGDGDVETLSGDGGGGGGAGAREGASTVKVLETDKAFRKCLRRSDRQLVVVCFSAQWCGPCKQMAPAFAALAQRHQTARFFQIDADQTLPTIADAYSVSSLPTFIFFKNRAPVKTVTGASAQVREALAALVSTLSAQCDLGSKKHTLDEDGDEDEKPGDDKMKRRRVHACPV